MFQLAYANNSVTGAGDASANQGVTPTPISVTQTFGPNNIYKPSNYNPQAFPVVNHHYVLIGVAITLGLIALITLIMVLVRIESSVMNKRIKLFLIIWLIGSSTLSATTLYFVVHNQPKADTEQLTSSDNSNWWTPIQQSGQGIISFFSPEDLIHDVYNNIVMSDRLSAVNYEIDNLNNQMKSISRMYAARQISKQEWQDSFKTVLGHMGNRAQDLQEVADSYAGYGKVAVDYSRPASGVIILALIIYSMIYIRQRQRGIRNLRGLLTVGAFSRYSWKLLHYLNALRTSKFLRNIS